MKALVVGLGMGGLYAKILQDKGANVVTVDADVNRNAHYTALTQCLDSHKESFDISIICTPNYTHYDLAQQVAPHTKILMVDKPGCKTADQWQQLVQAYPLTRIMMIKNNMWRTDADKFQQYAGDAKEIDLCWINQNRVPRPGSWFTDSELAYSGVSRDLVPHLLSIYACMEPQRFYTTQPYDIRWRQRWQLSDLKNSDYGTVTADGKYDVDDVIEFKIRQDTDQVRDYYITADWRSNQKDDIGCHYRGTDIKIDTDLGLCPEEAYANMIDKAVENYENQSWWQHQYSVDHWIHRTIDYITMDQFKVE